MKTFNTVQEKTNIKDYEPISPAISNQGMSQMYKEYCRPKLSELLASLKLDKTYHKARGNYLYYYKEVMGKIVEAPVLDFVSGYGTNLLGHNHIELKKVMKQCLDNDAPFTAQAANRPMAGLLAEKLNELIPNDEKYLCNFTNSGTEAVEAAIKHAYMVWQDEISREHVNINCKINDFFNETTTETSGIKLHHTSEIEALRHNILEFNNMQLNNFAKKGIICSFKGSFHGKTTSSVKVTYNKSFRESFEDMTTYETVFIDPKNPDEIEEVLTNNHFKLLYPKIENDRVVLKEKSFARLFAFIMEIVIGEGGVIPVPDNTLKEIAGLHKAYNFPLIIDEIQTGCGRTGSFFAYTNTPLKSIHPEYITLSKALGGGLAKIGATMIRENIYDHEFGLLHTSTFSEDDISCRIAFEAVRIITENDNFILREIENKGNYLLSQLNKLKEKYPDIIKDVRGKGLMLGLEFTDLSNYSPFFKYSGTQGFISMLAASYVLHYHDIRILAPLSTMFKGARGEKRKSVLRLQPSAYVEIDEINHVINALDEVLNVINSNNEFVLLAHLINEELSVLDRKFPPKFDKIPVKKITEKADIKLGFIVHITELDYLINHYLVSFNDYKYKRRELGKWWNKLCRFLEPDLMKQSVITSKDKKVEINIMCLPYLPKYMIRVFAEGRDMCNYNRECETKLTEMQDKIQDAAIDVTFQGNGELKTSVIGLGAYNSIVTDNGKDFNDYNLPVTTGNSYTTALMYQGLLKAADKIKLDLNNARAAIVGAGGNIGQAISELLAIKCESLQLIGRETFEGQQKLEKTRIAAYEFIREKINLAVDTASIEDLNILSKRLLKANNFELLPEYNEISNEVKLCLERFITISKLDEIKNADMVAIATNSTDTLLITPEKVKKGAIICCASVPSNLSEQFKGVTDEYFVFDSGYAKLPGDNKIDCIGMPKDGLVYGCLGETILLALDETKKSFSKGKVTSRKILETIEMAEKYGFELGKFVLGDHIKRMAT